MNKEIINSNFDINAKCQSMIEEANKIIKVYLETSNLYEDDGRYSLAYDVKNYLPKLQQENQQLKKEVEKWKSYTEITGEEGTCIINELKEELSSKTLKLTELKDEIKHLETKLLAVQQQFDMAVSLGNKKQHIIDELEKWLKETKLKKFEKEYGKRYGKVYTQAEIIVFNMILNKLQELKGSDKE